MKRLFIALFLALYTQVPMAMGDPQIEEKYNVYDGQNIFYLEMRVSEVYRILGQPDEILSVRNTVPNKDWNIVTLIYPGIVFRYIDFYDDPKIDVIALTGTGKEYRIGRLKVMGFSREDILEVYGNPEYITRQNENVYYRYELIPSGMKTGHIELQFRLNSGGICDEVMLIYSGFFV
jgi:hypothetical protein